MSHVSSGKTSAGIPVYVDKMADAKRAGFMVLMNTGSMDEKDCEAGISHLLEHVVFRATKTKTSFEMSKEIEAAGGSTNAYTSKEQTAFYAFSLSETKRVAEDLISDIINNTLISEKDTELEKKIVLQELSMCENSPEDYIHDLFDNVMWRGHPLGKDIIGTKESINSFTNKEVRKYYEEKYGIPNISVFAAGDVNLNEVVSWAESNFDGIRKVEANKRTVPGNQGPIYKHFKRKEDNCYVKIGFRGVSLSEGNPFVQELLAGVLCQGSSSRYFQKVREEKGLVYAIGCGNEKYPSASCLTTTFYSTSANVREAIDTIAKTTKDFIDGGFDKGELDRVKNMTKGNLISYSESCKNNLQLLVKSVTQYGRLLSIDDRLKMISEVSEEDILALAEKIMKPKHANIVMLADDVPKMKDFKIEEFDF